MRGFDGVSSFVCRMCRKASVQGICLLDLLCRAAPPLLNGSGRHDDSVVQCGSCVNVSRLQDCVCQGVLQLFCALCRQ
jgi:hypothetical protein